MTFARFSCSFNRSLWADAACALLLSACGGEDKAASAGAAAPAASGTDPVAAKVLNIGVCPGPYGKMLQDAVAPYLKDQGYSINIIEFTDYVQPDQALDSGELDANLFQHQSYLDGITEDQGLKLTSVINVPTLGMGLFSSKVTSLEAIPDGATAAIPVDAVNLARALRFARDCGLITLNDEGKNENKISTGDIAENPHHINFVPMEAAQITRSFDSIDLGFVPGNYAVAAKLDYSKALASEKVAEPIKNVIAVQTSHVDDTGKLLREAVQSDKFREAIESDPYYEAFTRPQWWSQQAAK